MLDPGRFHGELEGQGELVAIVRLWPPDRERARGTELAEERDAVPVIHPAVEAQHAVARAVIERRVLEHALTSNLDELHVHLDAVSGPVPLEQLELPWPALPDGLHLGEPELQDHALDRPLRDPEPMHPPEPELGPCGPIAEVDARMPNEVDQRGRDPPWSSRGYRGIRPRTPSALQRARQRRIVLVVHPKRRLAGRTPCVAAYSSTNSRSCTRSRSRLGTAASRITASHPLLMHSPFHASTTRGA